MHKIAIVYWSGTGNTELMANCVAAGARDAGAEVTLLSPGQFSAADVDNYQAIAFGCPAMGAEQLDEEEFEPMFSSVEGPSPAKRWPCSAPTAGATASGCGTGASAPAVTAPTSTTRRG